MRPSRPLLAVASALMLACAGEAPRLRHEVGDLRAKVERLERTNATQGQQIQALAEKISALQSSPMVVVAAPAPQFPATRPAPATSALVPPGLEVVKLDADSNSEPAGTSPRARVRPRPSPPVPTSVPIVEPQGALR